MIGAAIPPANVDVDVEVQPAEVELFATLEFPEAAYDLIARRVREREPGPTSSLPSRGNRVGGGRPPVRKGPGGKPTGNGKPNRR